jgi:hypothetical protein
MPTLRHSAELQKIFSFSSAVKSLGNGGIPVTHDRSDFFGRRHPRPRTENPRRPILFVCLFLFPFFLLCHRLLFCLSPKTKRIKWERREDLPVLGAPFCLSIHQVREKHNAIWLFVVAINVVVAPPVSFNSFSSPFFSFFFFGLSRLYFGGRVKETGQIDVFVAGAIESHDDDWLLISSAFRPTLANFPISCNL